MCLKCRKIQFILTISLKTTSDILHSLKLLKLLILGDQLNIDNNCFDSMVSHIHIYPSELQLNKANVSNTEALFFDIHLSISDDFVKTKIYNKRDDLNFEIVNFTFLDGDGPRSTSYGINSIK